MVHDSVGTTASEEPFMASTTVFVFSMRNRRKSVGSVKAV